MPMKIPKAGRQYAPESSLTAAAVPVGTQKPRPASQQSNWTALVRTDEAGRNPRCDCLNASPGPVIRQHHSFIFTVVPLTVELRLTIFVHADE
jgi:hypothetical protein